jgi:hypothetical protein
MTHLLDTSAVLAHVRDEMCGNSTLSSLRLGERQWEFDLVEQWLSPFINQLRIASGFFEARVATVGVPHEADPKGADSSLVPLSAADEQPYAEAAGGILNAHLNEHPRPTNSPAPARRSRR